MKILYAIRVSANWGILFFLIYIFSFVYIPIAKLIKMKRGEKFEIKTPKEALKIFKEFIEINYRSTMVRKQCKKSGQKCLYGGKLCWPEECKIAKSFDV